MEMDKLENKMGRKIKKVIENFMNYIVIDTCSDPNADTSPSTMKQHNLAKKLVDELTLLGIESINYDKEHCYVYASIPASEGLEDVSALGFVAHMDTSPAVTGTNVKPRIIENYDGTDILLNQAENVILKVQDFPNLLHYVGDCLIVTDGKTLLGADDKAGIAEIMAMLEYLVKHPDYKHGKICVAFTPDEEIGQGTDYFDLAAFAADFAYTVDGGALGELEYENFNAAGAKLVIQGRSVHPGDAKGKMLNSILIGQEFHSLLPVFENPMYTEKYEGFYHLDSFKGNVEETVLEYIIRDHDRILFEKKKYLFMKTVAFINEKYGAGTITLEMEDSYYNMKEMMVGHMHLIENASQAMKELSVEPIIIPIRGGTDGARLSYMGLPCPNICTGGENFHGKYEFISINSMEKITEILIRIVGKYCDMHVKR